MRPLVLAVLLSGCLAGSLGANMRPSVMPKLSELPADARQRDGILDQSGERARPEQRKGFTRRERQIETVAAIAAALIGESFSRTKTVTIGVATDIDENDLFEKPRPQRKAGPKAGTTTATDETKTSDLVPWIQLPQKSKPADIDSVR